MAIFTGNTVDEAIERGLKNLASNVKMSIFKSSKKIKKGSGHWQKRARVNIDAIQEETVRQADRLATRGLDAEFIADSPKVQSAMEATLELSQVVKAVKAAEKASTGDLSQEDKEAIIEELRMKLLKEN
jgi:spoIIIJ-associated protein